MDLTPAVVEKIHLKGGSFLVSDRGNPPHAEMAEQGYECSVAGIPKTIDNDIPLLDFTFGFHTAVAEAVRAIDAAYVESSGNANCLGLVKLMGRSSGFIACWASLAARHVDLCLIPEMNIDMNKVLDYIVELQKTKSNAVVVIAEGLGDTLIQGDGSKDAGGNKIMADVGPWFKKQIE